MTDEEKMELAVNQAREALKHGEMPVGACIFLENELISEAYTTEVRDKRFLVHAEINALLKADRLNHEIPDRKKMQLFTTLEPCLMCYGSAMSFFIGEIYYSLKAPEDGALNLIRFDRFTNDYLKFVNPKVHGGILTEEAKELFSEYMKGLDRNTYLYRFSESVLTAN